VFTSRVTNITASAVRRRAVAVHVGYGKDLRAVSEALVAAARRSEGVLDEPAPRVHVDALGVSDIALELRFWTDSRRSDFVATSSNVRASAVEALRAPGIGLPDPGRYVIEPGQVEAWRTALGTDRGS
jgi:small-conductance mechanosensitive channel